MTFLKIIIILAILWNKSQSDDEMENRFCETKTFDYAFNFVDKDQYPNGIMIRKDDFTTVFNDDLFQNSFTDEMQIMKMYRKSEFWIIYLVF